MAGSSLLTLIDDIATLLDDIAVLSKVAVKKTAGVLGDDLALNAQQVSGVRANRELPVVWAVAKGSFLNKLILVPSALLISAFAPWAIPVLLVLGGAFLCFEGVEKILHKVLHRDDDTQQHEKTLQALSDPNLDMAAFEKQKIKGAIRTDFILSAEIIVIILGTLQEVDFTEQVVVLTLLAFGFTVAVYGVVAGIVKLDDAGLYLTKLSQPGGWAAFKRKFGKFLLLSAPYLMKTLSIVGTAAMFLVGGGILVHSVPFVHHIVVQLTDPLETLTGVAATFASVVPLLLDAVVGIVLGLMVYLVVIPSQKLFHAIKQRK